MHFPVAILLVVSAILASFGQVTALARFPNINSIGIDLISRAVDLWAKFKLDNFKRFAPEEDAIRFNIFKDNLLRIDEFTKKFEKGEVHFRVGINQFADLTKDEFVNKFLTLKTPQNRVRRELPRSNRTARQVPQFLDWRQRGAVTPVKNQGNCASCWAFSAVGAIESQYYLKSGNLVSLSEQNLIDCATDQKNNGCYGGWMANAFQYLTSNIITSENEYAYAGTKQTCDYKMKNVKLSVRGYQTIPPDEHSLQQAVTTVGPVSVAMDATNLQFYAGGVFRDDECAPGRVNHGLLLVGYGTEGGRDYWLIKNSWGAKWGEEGYFKMIRNRNNQCGIASYGMYPTL